MSVVHKMVDPLYDFAYTALVYHRKELRFAKDPYANPICGNTDELFSLQFLGAKISGVVQISP